MQKKYFFFFIFFLLANVLLAKENTRKTIQIDKTKITIPTDYRLPTAQKRLIHFNDFIVVLYSRSFAQGDAVYMEILPQRNSKYNIMRSKVSLEYKNKFLPLTKKRWGYRTLWGIDPDEKKSTLLLKIQISNFRTKLEETLAVSIKKTNWPTSTSSIRIRKRAHKTAEQEKEFYIRLGKERKRKHEAFQSDSNDFLTASWSHPRDMHYITSEFWKKRTYQYYDYKNKKRIGMGTSTRIHRGLDLRGRTGDPIFAIADGLVVLAEHMYYEGNFVLIDHGNKIFSGYMHQSKLFVKEGQFIKAGQHIGNSGNTGRVSGAHLHVSIYMNGVMVDPLSLLLLPIRD